MVSERLEPAWLEPWLTPWPGIATVANLRWRGGSPRNRNQHSCGSRSGLASGGRRPAVLIESMRTRCPRVTRNSASRRRSRRRTRPPRRRSPQDECAACPGPRRRPPARSPTGRRRPSRTRSRSRPRGSTPRRPVGRRRIAPIRRPARWRRHARIDRTARRPAGRRVPLPSSRFRAVQWGRTREPTRPRFRSTAPSEGNRASDVSTPETRPSVSRRPSTVGAGHAAAPPRMPASAARRRSRPRPCACPPVTSVSTGSRNSIRGVTARSRELVGRRVATCVPAAPAEPVGAASDGTAVDVGPADVEPPDVGPAESTATSHARNAPASQSACASCRMFGLLAGDPAAAASRAWTAWPNSWASDAVSPAGPYRSSSTGTSAEES